MWSLYKHLSCLVLTDYRDSKPCLTTVWLVKTNPTCESV